MQICLLGDEDNEVDMVWHNYRTEDLDVGVMPFNNRQTIVDNLAEGGEGDDGSDFAITRILGDGRQSGMLVVLEDGDQIDPSFSVVVIFATPVEARSERGHKRLIV